MVRIRSTKPEFWADEDLADLPRDARLLYMGLWNLADEHGRLRGDARYIKGQLFPYDDDLPPGSVQILLEALHTAGKAIRYVADGRSYLHLPTLCRHQRLEPDKVPSRLPAPPEKSLTQSHADKSAWDADKSEPHAEDHALLYVAGTMEHVAGTMEHGDARAPARARPGPPDFAAFWSVYPRKEAKEAARKAWDKATKRADPPSIITGAQRYRDDPNREQQFTAHPATWLNAGRWTDDPLPIRGSPNGRVTSTTDNRVDQALRLAAELEQHEIEP